MSGHEWDYCDVTDEDVRSAVEERLRREGRVPLDVDIEFHLADWGEDDHSARWRPTDWVPPKRARRKSWETGPIHPIAPGAVLAEHHQRAKESTDE